MTGLSCPITLADGNRVWLQMSWQIVSGQSTLRPGELLSYNLSSQSTPKTLGLFSVVPPSHRDDPWITSLQSPQITRSITEFPPPSCSYSHPSISSSQERKPSSTLHVINMHSTGVSVHMAL